MIPFIIKFITTMNTTKKDIEAVYQSLLDNVKETYMASDDEKNKYEQQSQDIIDALKSDEYAMDAFKNLLFAMYKYSVYEASSYPFFTCEDEFVMQTFESLIRTNYGDDFLHSHRLQQTHWMFANGAYPFLFDTDFVQTVY
jgi:hypothetical protein